MKFTLILIISLVALLLIVQGFVWKSTNEIESLKYEVVKSYSDFEIRKYEASNFCMVDLPGQSYSGSSSSGFRILANYIFGGNERQQQIAMTSPVAMNMDKSVEMMFMVPSEYELDELPKPNNNAVQFHTEPEKVVAVRRFGGWASDEVIQEEVARLKQSLEEQNIRFKNRVTYFGYNPPYQLVNRRNEVVLEVMGF